MNNYSTVFLLLMIAVVGVFTLDVYLPGIPSMAADFDVSMTAITYTFTGFSAVFAINQLIHGALSDVIGRKPVIVSGLVIAAAATILCIQAETYWSLFGARMMQAIGISSFVVVNAIIRDLYVGVKAIQIRTLVTTASGITISIAPTIGGVLQDRFNWQGGFIASLVLILATMLYAIIFYSESIKTRAESKLTLTYLMLTYRQLFSSHRYMLYIIMATLAFTMHFTFIVLSAKIIINDFGFSILEFGYFMLVYGGIYFISGLVTNIISTKMSLNKLIMIGGMGLGVCGLMMLVSSMLIPVGIAQILLPMAMMTLGITIVRSASTTGALAPIPTQSGQGAAGLNLVQFLLSAVVAATISSLDVEPRIVLGILAIVSSVAILALLHLLNSHSINKESEIVIKGN